MKAIIPIAGLGTRLLPLTKVIPKAMLPVAGKPGIQWIVEELVAAEVEDIIFVYSRGQEIVQEYFSKKTWYDEELLRRGKTEEVKMLDRVRNLARFQFVEQKELLGDGHAILQARTLMGDEPFLVIFGDCLYRGDDVIQKMINAHQKTNSCVIAVQKIAASEAKHYGIASPFDKLRARNDIFPISSLIEKPHQQPVTSNQQTSLALVGRYLLTSAIWPHLEKKYSGSGEVRLIDALQALLTEEPLHGVELNGQWLDTGTLEGLEKASAALADARFAVRSGGAAEGGSEAKDSEIEISRIL